MEQLQHRTIHGAYCWQCNDVSTASHHGFSDEPATCDRCGFNIRCVDCGSSACFVDYYPHDTRLKVEVEPVGPELDAHLHDMAF